MPSIQTAENTLKPRQLLPLYLENRRQRFKAEINRLTGGGMLRLLEKHRDATDLAFLLT